MDLVGAFKRPFSDGKKLVIGALMYLIPVVNIITGIFGMGYMLKAAKGSFGKDKSMPEWTGWGDMFVKGILAYITVIIWMIPVAIVAMIVAGTAIAGLFTNMEALQAGNMTPLIGILGGAGIGAVILVILIILTDYVVPAAIFNYIKVGKFGAAFDFGIIFKKAFTGKYFIAWLLAVIGVIVISIILSIISGLVAAIPFLSLIIMAFGAFIMGIFFVTALGETYGEL